MSLFHIFLNDNINGVCIFTSNQKFSLTSNVCSFFVYMSMFVNNKMQSYCNIVV